jgi:hypothetical protein
VVETVAVLDAADRVEILHRMPPLQVDDLDGNDEAVSRDACGCAINRESRSAVKERRIVRDIVVKCMYEYKVAHTLSSVSR